METTTTTNAPVKPKFTLTFGDGVVIFGLAVAAIYAVHYMSKM